MNDNTTKPELFEVTLDRPHTDAGVKYEAGAKIKVSKSTRDWLIANKIVNSAPPAQKDGAK